MRIDIKRENWLLRKRIEVLERMLKSEGIRTGRVSIGADDETIEMIRMMSGRTGASESRLIKIALLFLARWMIGGAKAVQQGKAWNELRKAFNRED